MKKQGMLPVVFVSLSVTLSLICVFFLGWKLGGLSFAPFDIFDWITRIVPGSVISFSIDSMVKVIRFINPGSGTAVAAKAVEHSLAVIIFLLAGTVVGLLILSIIARSKKSKFLPGIILSVTFYLFVLVINISLGRATIINELWNLTVFVIWGLTFGWIFARIGVIPGVDVKETGSVERIDRRKFLIRLGGVSAAFVVTGAVVDALTRMERKVIPAGEKWSAHHELPNVDAAVKAAPGTRAEFTPVENHYRIDIDATPPLINEGSWQLKVSGLVEKPLELSLQQIRDYEPSDQFITLSCISNPVGGDLIGTQRWTGVSLQRIIHDLKLKQGAAYLIINSADGFYEAVSLDLINKDSRIMLTYAWDGLPLPSEHGFPLRIYIPDRYGMKQPKWIESIEVVDKWESGYWVDRGWDKDALMKATSVIDTIAVGNIISDAQGRKLIPVGGIAHAGDRSISKVEVKIDNGEWLETELRTPLSDLTWVIWRFNMPFQAGEHKLTVRCYDGNGIPQIITVAPPHPSGATGLDARVFKA